MNSDLNRILDDCLDRVSRGEDMEPCLAAYPAYAEQLRPLLSAAMRTVRAYRFTPEASAKAQARQAFQATLADVRSRRAARRSLWPGLLGWSKVWAAAAAAVLVAAVTYFAVRPTLLPTETTPEQAPGDVPPVAQPSPQPSPEGNFVFLISDDVNAIDDFASLLVSISSIGLVRADSEEIEFMPEVSEVDLTQLQGDRAQEVWRGNVPEGGYTKVFIRVSSVRGILKETGETVDVKLPSSKLQITSPFKVSADSVTSFTYDLTVIAAGNERGGIRYLLRPVIGESGARTERGAGRGRPGP